MALVINPTTGAILFTEDPTAYYQQGYRDPTADELEHGARTEEFGGFAQQAQAQVERVVRGATLGAVEGFGDEADIRARAEVSEELSPITSFAASVVPDVAVAAATGGLGGLATGAGRAAGRAALAEGAGIVRAGLSAARAGGAAALAGESVGTGLVAAGQNAYADGREFADDPGRFAEDALIWGGLNFGLGAAAMKLAGGSGAKAAKALDGADESLDDIAAAAEFRGAKGTASELDGVPITPVEAAPANAPLDNVQMLGPDGMLDTVAPDDPRLAAIAPELDRLRTEGLTGKSLKDLRALPIDDPQFPEATRGSREKIDWMKQEPTFLAEGNLPGARDRSRGGLPSIGIEGDVVYLNNGRHRLTAAKESGLEEIVMNVKSYDAEGNTLWDYVGPVRVNAAPVPAGAVRQGEREAVEGGLERGLRNASKAEADDLVEQAIGSAPVAEADSFGRQRRLYINRKAIQEVAAREMQQDLTKLVGDVGEVTRADKLASIAREVGSNLSAQRGVANGIAQDAAKFAGELRAEARAYGAAAGKKGLQYAIPGQKSLTLALMDNAKAIQKATTGKGLFEALDSFKRTAQEYKLSLEQGALNSANPIHHQQLIPKIDAFASKVRASLEDAGTWGKAGEMQKAYNAVISDRLMPSMRIFEESVLQRTHKGYDGMWKTEGWETKISSLLKNTDPGQRRHVGAVLDAMDELAGVRRQFGDAKMAAKIEANTAKVRRTVGLADEVTDATERMQALGDIVSGVPMGGAIAGGIAGGLPGAAIGAALPGAVRGFVMGDLISSFQRLSGATDAAVSRGVDDWIASSKVRGGGVRALADRVGSKLPQLSGEAKQLAEVAARRGVSQGMALFMGDHDSPGAAFEELRDKLLDEEGFYQSIEDEYGTLRNEAPEVFMAIAGRAALARQFLIERMPPNVAVSMANPSGYPPSREAVEDWATYVNAVRHPARVAKNIGALTQQEVETLRTVHPRMHELIQQRVIEGIARAQQAGTQLDDNFLARMNLYFPDMDGAGSPVFGQELGGVIRDYNAMKKQSGGGRPGSSSTGKANPAPMNATIQGGATFGLGL